MSSNEIYCRSCGEQIKRDAEICPECGVRNAQAQARGAAAGSSRGQVQAATGGRQSGADQTSTRETSTRSGSEPSDSWVYGVAIGGVLWAIVLFLQVQSMLAVSRAVTMGGAPPPGNVLGGLGAAFLQSPALLLAWVVLPLSMYFDSKYVSMNSDLDVSTGLYVGAPVLAPIFNTILFMVGIVVGINPVFAAIVPLLMVALTGYYLKQRQDAL